MTQHFQNWHLSKDNNQGEVEKNFHFETSFKYARKIFQKIVLYEAKSN